MVYYCDCLKNGKKKLGKPSFAAKNANKKLKKSFRSKSIETCVFNLIVKVNKL